jgi:hypothetical protein
MNSNSVNNLNDERFIFGNFGGIVPPRYVKYCNLVALELLCIIIFAIIYFPLLLKYDKYLMNYDEFPKQYLYCIMFWRAILHSINYQAAANYTPLNFKHVVMQSIITFQLVISLLLVFLFITV